MYEMYSRGFDSASLEARLDACRSGPGPIVQAQQILARLEVARSTAWQEYRNVSSPF